jgi:hypothetical protein
MVKYAAYRDRASTRAELFCPEGVAAAKERKEFVAFVARSVEESRPQLFRGRDGQLLDRRRSVYRFILSPERADGLDLERLLRQAVERLETEMAVGGLRWLAAIHRNTKHHHIHFVLAGMYRSDGGTYRRVDLPKRRLAAMKHSIALEIERQRGERTAAVPLDAATERASRSVADRSHRPSLLIGRPSARVSSPSHLRRRRPKRLHHKTRPAGPSPAMLRIQAAARRMASEAARDAADEARGRGWEHAA